MSTPIFNSKRPPPATAGEMQQRVQHMINLQNDQLQLSQRNSNGEIMIPAPEEIGYGLKKSSTSSSRGFNNNTSSGGGDQGGGEVEEGGDYTTVSINNDTIRMIETTTLGRTSMSRSSGIINLQQADANNQDPPPPPPPQVLLAPPPPLSFSSSSQGCTSTMDDAGLDPSVGKGTLFFNSETLKSVEQQQHHQQQDYHQHQNQHELLLLPQQQEGFGLMAGLVPANSLRSSSNNNNTYDNNNNNNNINNSTATYGSLDNDGMDGGGGNFSSSLPTNLETRPLHWPQQQQQQQHVHGYHHNAGSGPSKQPNSTTLFLDRRNNRRATFLRSIVSCWTCLWKLAYCLFCCCSTDAIGEQQLQQSLCYGAIDGMLTGSGIVATFCGMDILAPTSILSVRVFVVAFSAVACFSDSLCMALGHVWTTHVMVTAAARERMEQRLAMERNKADAKGRLVDMLLERGMLKIDAMSLADTLEGYPDMFVSALSGDALIAGGVGGPFRSREASSPTLNHRRSFSGGAGQQRPSHHSGSPANAGEIYQEEAGSNSGLLWRFPSYGQHLAELENELNPEAAIVSTAMTESRREGLLMMMGFSLFAIVPSLIYLVVPMLIKTQHAKNSKHTGTDGGGGTSALTIMLTTTAVIMWCLGVWKSRFVDSNWMVFGIETVVVLVLCVVAAYGLGTLLVAIVPEIDSSILKASSDKDSL